MVLEPIATDEFLPKPVREAINELKERIDSVPVVTRLDHGYHVVYSSERVVLTMDWRRGARPGAFSYHSTLSIDGAQVPLAKDIDDFVSIWNDPDPADRRDKGRIDRLALEDLDDARIPPLGEPQGDVPPLVQGIASKQGPGVKKWGGSVQIGCHGDEWQILISTTTPAGRSCQMYFGVRPDAQGHYVLSREFLSVRLAVDGRDCTHLIAEIDLAELGIVPPSPEPAQDLPTDKLRREVPAARQNSVTVRKATVIRT